MRLRRYGVVPRTGTFSSSLTIKKIPNGKFVLFDDAVDKITRLESEITKLRKLLMSCKTSVKDM